MIRKRVMAAVGLVFLVVIALSIVTRETDSDSDYLFDANSKITLKDVEQAKRPARFPAFDEDFNFADEESENPVEAKHSEATPKTRINRFMAELNHNTLKYFRYLHRSYEKSKDLDEHLEKVLEHLRYQLSEEDAMHALKVYREYLQCEIDLAAESAHWTQPTNPREALEMLVKMQEYRRKVLGPVLADGLYGAEVKSGEYVMRRSIIAQDQDLYGSEKEQHIEQLNREMWGEEAETVNQKPKPYHRYREKLQLYAKDLGELSPEETKEKITEFRHTLFSAETISRLEEVDTQMERENRIEETYFQQESAVLNNPNLSAAEKEETLTSLQDEMFGDQAESFRRREAIRKGLERLKSQATAGKQRSE
jgi:lipase chaperone LimK